MVNALLMDHRTIADYEQTEEEIVYLASYDLETVPEIRREGY